MSPLLGSFGEAGQVRVTLFEFSEHLLRNAVDHIVILNRSLTLFHLVRRNESNPCACSK